MAKGQKRSNREAKKPKQPKADKKTGPPSFLSPPKAGPAGSGRNREGPRR